jgi:hypothetical protein
MGSVLNSPANLAPPPTLSQRHCFLYLHNRENEMIMVSKAAVSSILPACRDGWILSIVRMTNGDEFRVRESVAEVGQLL